MWVQQKAALLVFHCKSLTTAARISLGARAVAALEFGTQPDVLWAATSDLCLQCFDARAGAHPCLHSNCSVAQYEYEYEGVEHDICIRVCR